MTGIYAYAHTCHMCVCAIHFLQSLKKYTHTCLQSSSIAPMKQLAAHEDSVRAILQVDDTVWTTCVNGEVKRWRTNWSQLALSSSQLLLSNSHSGSDIHILSPRSSEPLSPVASPGRANPAAAAAAARSPPHSPRPANASPPAARSPKPSK